MTTFSRMVLSVLILCALDPVVARTTPAAQTQPIGPELTFVTGEARAIRVDRARREFWQAIEPAAVVATMETRPCLRSDERFPERSAFPLSWLIRMDALANVFGEKGYPPSERDRAYEIGYLQARGRAGILHQTPNADDETEQADLWSIIAIDEATAKAVAEALVRSYRDTITKLLEKARDDLNKRTGEAEKLRQAIADDEALLKKLEDDARKLGVYGMTLETLDAAIARFDQERRLNEIEIAGLQASLDAAAKRLAVSVTATAKEHEDVQETVRTLSRIQVELGIQLVGKLARKDALGRTLDQLQEGRSKREDNNAAHERIFKAQSKLAEYEKDQLPKAEQNVQRLEKLAAFTVTDNRVVISPILRTNP